jgi:hypothetical protein
MRNHPTDPQAPRLCKAGLWLDAALRIALSKPAPMQFDLSNTANFYRVDLTTEDSSSCVWVQSYYPEKGIEGLGLGDEGRYDVEMCLPLARGTPVRFRAKRWIGEHHFEYQSLGHFLLFERLPIRRLHVTLVRVWERCTQSVFNKKKLVRHERIKILQFIFEKTLIDRNFITSPVMLPAEFHSVRYIHHPQSDEQISYSRLILNSLVASGDLQKRDNVSYSLAPKALQTLSAYEEDDRRHRDMLRQQRALNLLTCALIGVGLLQVYVSWK